MYTYIYVCAGARARDIGDHANYVKLCKSIEKFASVL